MKRFICLFVFLFASSANATLITFESGNSSTAASNAGDFIDNGGYRFTNLEPRSSNGFLFVVSSAGAPNNTSSALFNANDASFLMTAVDGSSFDLFSFDFARRPNDTSDNRSAEYINVIGTLFAGGTVSFQTNDLQYSFLTASLNSFTGLSSVLFAPVINANQGSNNYEFQVDNISVSASTVPEPSALALLGLGLIGIRFSRKKKIV